MARDCNHRFVAIKGEVGHGTGPQQAANTEERLPHFLKSRQADTAAGRAGVMLIL
jgi:hypothetical protein